MSGLQKCMNYNIQTKIEATFGFLGLTWEGGVQMGSSSVQFDKKRFNFRFCTDSFMKRE